VRDYTHVIPAGEERTREAVDRALAVDGLSSAVLEVS
jgi:hypothetical protein